MTALAKDVQRRKLNLHGTIRIGLPAKADAIIYEGALVAVGADGMAVPAADAAGLKVMGVAFRGLDNTDGADGEIGSASARFCEVETGAYSFEVTGTPVAGEAAFVADDNTVTDAATATNDIPVGIFLEPDAESSSRWYVLIQL